MPGFRMLALEEPVPGCWGSDMMNIGAKYGIFSAHREAGNFRVFGPDEPCQQIRLRL
jgi:hypothetical protein